MASLVGRSGNRGDDAQHERHPGSLQAGSAALAQAPGWTSLTLTPEYHAIATSRDEGASSWKAQRGVQDVVESNAIVAYFVAGVRGSRTHPPTRHAGATVLKFALRRIAGYRYIPCLTQNQACNSAETRPVPPSTVGFAVNFAVKNLGLWPLTGRPFWSKSH